MRTPNYTKKFKQDYKTAKSQNRDMLLLKSIMSDLITERKLDKRHKDHILIGNYQGCRECHISSDWLLIYRLVDDIIVFERTGTHAILFKK
jgi:mRNA interferase YafQ